MSGNDRRLSPTESRPVDLHLRATTRREPGQRFLAYELSSPSERIETRLDGRSAPLPTNVADLSRQFYHELEDLLSGVGTEKAYLIGGEVEERLRTVGKNLYRKLLPANIREVFDQPSPFEDLSLLVESDEPWFPWEVLHTYGAGGDFFCLRYRMGQWPSRASSRARLPEKSFEVSRFLAIDAGHLSLVGRQSPPLLPKSAVEVALLRNLAKDSPSLEEVPLDGPRYDEVIRRLREGGFQWLHFVGHGEFPESGSADLASLVLEQQNLQARDLIDDIEEALSRERPFVFLNACRISRQGPSFTGLGGWPSALIDICGCGGFLAPRLAVRNQHAFEVARDFYSHVNRGKPLGEAVRQARIGTRSKPGPRSLNVTALAYVYYGHPNAFARLGMITPTGKDATASRDVESQPSDGVEEIAERIPDSSELAVHGVTNPHPSGDRSLTQKAAALPLLPRALRRLAISFLLPLPLLLFLLGATSHRSREIMLRISPQSYPASDLFATGIQAPSEFFVNGLTALSSSQAVLQSSAWGLLGLAVFCLAASHARHRMPPAGYLAIAVTVLALGIGISLYTFALRARHPDEHPFETSALCSAEFRSREGDPSPITEQIVVASCIWLTSPTLTHEEWRQSLSGLMLFFLLASSSALWCGLRMGPQPGGWREYLRRALLGAHLVVLLLILRQMPLAYAYSRWGLEYPTVEVEGSCESELGELLAAETCCAFDVSAGAKQTVLLVRGARCSESGEWPWDEKECRLIKRPVRAVPQGCGL